MPLAPAIDDPSMLPTCENCYADDIVMTPGTDVVLCTRCSVAALKILAGWPGWPPKVDQPSQVTKREVTRLRDDPGVMR